MNNIKITLLLIFAVYFLISQNGASPARAEREKQVEADTLLSEREYYSKLQAADDVTFKQDFETYFLLLLDSEQKKAYEGLPSLDEKKAYIQNYWKAANPNPLFPENDWLLEFNRRVQYARKHFRRKSPPYVDDRGRYYIKYGEPYRRYVDRGGRVTYEDDFRLRYSTLANETWSYENIRPNFVLYFIKGRGSFRRTRTLYDAVIDNHVMRNFTKSNDPDMEYFIWGDMIKKRETTSLALFRAAAYIRANGDLRDPGVNVPPQTALRVKNEELTLGMKVARDKAPSAAYSPLQAENKLKFLDRVAQFRGPAGKTRIDLALLVPLRKNLVKKVKESSEDTVTVEFSGMLRDENFEFLVKNQSLSLLEVKLAAREELPNAVGKFSLLARPQDAELTLQVQEKQREETGYSRRPLEIWDFTSTDELMISDIQLNYQIKNDIQKKILPILQHRDFPVSPYPFLAILKEKPALVYFEIYNIQSAGMGDRMQISYTITPVKGNEASVNVSFTRPVLSENTEELVEIDLKNVKKGWNLLKVVVSSLQDSTIKAVSQRRILVRKLAPLN